MSVNMRLRIISASLMITVIITILFWLPIIFNPFIVLLGFFMLNEWFEMTKTSVPHLLIGLLIIPLPIISLSVLHQIDHNGWLLFTYIALVCCVDSFAMLGGRQIGGAKLAPILSPNKTWSGLISGIIGTNISLYLLSFLPGYLCPIQSNLNSIAKILLISGFCVLEQTSDLFISYFKRRFKIKDSGKIIPGHGGIIDRLDGMILTAPIFLLMVWYL